MDGLKGRTLFLLFQRDTTCPLLLSAALKCETATNVHKKKKAMTLQNAEECYGNDY